VIVPVCAAAGLLLLAAGEEELAGLEAVLDELLLEQPAAAIAASATTVKAERRILTPWLNPRGRDQLVLKISTETLAALTAATRPLGPFRAP
jgi:hypothetical protein